MWSPCLDMVKLSLASPSVTNHFRFQVKLCATAPLCNILMVSFYLPFFSLLIRVRSYSSPCAPHERGASTVPVPQQGRKIQGPELRHWACPTSVISAKSSGLRVSLPSHATSPKDLGTYSPREIHMRKPMSGCARHSAYAPILGFYSNMRRKDETCNTAGVAPQPTWDASQQAQ